MMSTAFSAITALNLLGVTQHRNPLKSLRLCRCLNRTLGSGLFALLLDRISPAELTQQTGEAVRHLASAERA